MNAEEVWIQIKVVADRVQHYSKPQALSPEDVEKMTGLAESIAKVSRNDGGYISFEIEAGDAWTFIPARNIDYITVMKVSAPE